MPKMQDLGRVERTTKSLQIGEIISVFTIGVATVLGGQRLLGHHPVASVVSVWLANVFMLAVIFGGLRVRAQGWDHFGLRDDIFEFKSIRGVVLRSIMVFVVAILAFVAGAIVMANIVGVPDVADMSKYDYLRGNLRLTMLALFSVYLVSSFAEEVIYRGFLITRLVELCNGCKGAHGFAIASSSLVFGLVHSDWGLTGMVQASCMGAALGASYLIVGRNLWVTILAHAYMDTILVLQMYW